MGPGRGAGQPQQGALRRRVHVRRAEALERGHEGHAARVGHGRRQRLALGRRLEEPQSVAPADDRAAGDDRSLEEVRVDVAQPPQAERVAARAVHPLLPGVHVDHDRRAVRRLAGAGLEAELAEHRGLLVAGGGGNRDAGAAEEVGVGVPVDRARRRDGRELLDRQAEEAGEIGRPLPGRRVPQRGRRRVRRVRDERPAAGEPVDEPAVERADEGLAGGHLVAEAGDVLQQPLDLRQGRHRVDGEPDERAQLQAAGVRAEVLPDERVVERPARGPVPGEGRRPLPGHAGGGDHRAVGSGAGHRLGDEATRDGPDLLRVVLEQAGGRGDLGELPVRARDLHAAAVVEDGPDPRGPGVDGKNERRGHVHPPTGATRWKPARPAWGAPARPAAGSPGS